MRGPTDCESSPAEGPDGTRTVERPDEEPAHRSQRLHPGEGSSLVEIMNIIRNIVDTRLVYYIFITIIIIYICLW